MNRTRFTFICLLASPGLLVSFGPPKPEFSYKTYGNIANYFANGKDLLDFFDFKKGQVVAEVGSGNANNAAAFALLTDSVTFYLEDIDKKALNQKNLDKVLRKCRKYKPVLTSTFSVNIGTEKSTLLPGNAFDKIILVATFHEFFYMDEMMSDICSKLKPDGRIYILESHCGGQGHKNYTMQEAAMILEKLGFMLERSDQTDRNGGKGVYVTSFKRK